MEIDHSKSLYDFLLQKGIVVRDRSNAPLCSNCLRITVGTPNHNQTLVEALESYQKEKNESSRDLISD